MRTFASLLIALCLMTLRMSADMLLITNTGTTVSWLNAAQTYSVGLDENDLSFDQASSSVSGTNAYTFVGPVTFSSAAHDYPNASGYTLHLNAPNPAAIAVATGGMFSGLSNVTINGTSLDATFSVAHDGGNLLAGNGGVSVSGASPTNPVTNLRIVAPGGIATPGALTPAFAAEFDRFAGGRFMNNSNINNNVNPLSVADVLPSGQNINTTGNSIHDQIGWINANPNAKTMFVSLPFNADKSYVQAIATAVKNELKPGVSVMWETGNEPWNFAFTHGGWLLQQGQADTAHNYVDSDNFGRVGEYYGILSATKMQWVQQVIPTAKGFLNSQGANQWFVDQSKNAIARNFGASAVDQLFGWQGISYYPTDNLTTNPGTVDGLYQAVVSDLQRQHGYLANDIADAHASGLKEFVYETSTNGFLTASGVTASLMDQFLADPKSGAATTALLSDLKSQLTQPGEGAAWFTQSGDYWGGTPDPLAPPTQELLALNAFLASQSAPEPAGAFVLIAFTATLLLRRAA